MRSILVGFILILAAGAATAQLSPDPYVAERDDPEAPPGSERAVGQDPDTVGEGTEAFIGLWILVAIVAIVALVAFVARRWTRRGALWKPR